MFSRRSTYKWHKRIGLAISLVIIVISITGIALNHNATLQLDQHNVENKWVLKHYGFAANEKPVSFQVGSHTITYLEGNLYHETETIGESHPLLGLTQIGPMYITAGVDEVLLWNQKWHLIEKLSTASLPEGEIVRIANVQNKLLLETAVGYYLSDEEILTWVKAEKINKQISWSKPIETPPAIQSKILKDFRGEGLSLYHLILDLHSGRFFGTIGVLLYDLSAIGLILLTLSGVYMWYKWGRR